MTGPDSEPPPPPPPSGPPGIPLLVSGAADKLDRKKKVVAKRRREKKGKRRTVRIPDDHVPSATPNTPEAAAGPRTAFDSMRDSFDSMPDDGGPIDSQDERDSFADEAPGSAADAPADYDDTAPAAVQPPIDGGDAPQLAEPVDETPTAPAPPTSRSRLSAPGVYTDDQAIMVLRPIAIVSDLPAVEPTVARETGGADEIEEIEPERMSLPGGVISMGTLHTPGQQQQRPLPPPRSAQAPAVQTAAASAHVPATQQAGAAIPGPQPEPPAPAAAPVEMKAETTIDTTRMRRPWWQEMFEDDMVRTLDNPRQREVERDTNFIEQSLRLPPGSRVLDLACGHGVHAVELAARGYQVVAVDLSATMLTLARQYSEKRGQQVSLVQGDMRQLDLDGVFDGIVCWSHSFGYFEDAVNVNVLERMARALKPAGKLVLDVANRDFVAPRSPSMAWFERQGCVCMDEVRFDFFTSRLVVKRMVMFDGGRAREIEYSMRLYSAHDLGRMLQQVGLKVTEVSGHRSHRGAFFGCESPRIMLVAERSP